MEEFPHGKGDHKNHLKLYTIFLLGYIIIDDTIRPVNVLHQ
jgi:hypothetical protein